MPVVMPMPYPGPAGGSPAPPPAAANGNAEESAKLIEIKSPMVGTFYAAPSPDAKPFVTLRSEVSEETDVCVIEAMKVFNNVKADCKGTIAKIMVNNGQVVEFGQVLFLVKP
jgi:acetyl-CoA carboxylase biotin carboxyl carrier protein